MRGFVKPTLHAVRQFGGESPLHLSAAQGSGDPGATLSVIRISRADTELNCFGATFFATALLEFPAVHKHAPFTLVRSSLLFHGIGFTGSSL